MPAFAIVVVAGAVVVPSTGILGFFFVAAVYHLVPPAQTTTATATRHSLGWWLVVWLACAMNAIQQDNIRIAVNGMLINCISQFI